MKAMRVFSGTDGESHLQEIEIPTIPVGPNMASRPMPVSDLHFMRMHPNNLVDYHNAPWVTGPRVVVVMSGMTEFDCGNGEVHRAGPGSVTFFDNFDGRGHISRVLEGPKDSIHLALPHGFSIDRWVNGSQTG